MNEIKIKCLIVSRIFGNNRNDSNNNCTIIIILIYFDVRFIVNIMRKSRKAPR